MRGRARRADRRQRSVLARERRRGPAQRRAASGSRSGSGSTSTSLALAVSGLIYWLTARTGFSAVVNPDSNPTLSLSVYMFFAPALLWIGATLLLVRLRGRGARAGSPRRAAGGRATTPRGFLLASAGRRGAAINRGLLVVGLLLAFGVNLGIFTATYDQQARVDAQLTLGADVVATAPPGVAAQHDLAARIAAVPGVAARDRASTTPTPTSAPTCRTPSASTRARSRAATTLRDSYFLGGTRRADCSTRLRATPRRDPRLQGDDHRLLAEPRRPAAPARARPPHRPLPRRARSTSSGSCRSSRRRREDSFMVANLAYLAGRRPRRRPERRLRQAPATRRPSPRASPRRPRADGTIVKNIRQQTAQTVSSITTVDLRGISRHRGGVRDRCSRRRRWRSSSRSAIAERRHEFATMAAARRSLREIGAFVWSEAALVLGAGARARRRPRLAARGDARRDAPARLRPAARQPRHPVALPRRAARRRARRKHPRRRGRCSLAFTDAAGAILREQ